MLAAACDVTFDTGSSAVTPTSAWPSGLALLTTVQVCLPHAGLWRCTEPDGFHPHLRPRTAGTVLHWGEYLNELLSTYWDAGLKSCVLCRKGGSICMDSCTLVPLLACRSNYLTRTLPACLSCSSTLCLQAPQNAIVLWSVPPLLRPFAMSMQLITIHVLGDVPSAPALSLLQSWLRNWRSSLLLHPRQGSLSLPCKALACRGCCSIFCTHV